MASLLALRRLNHPGVAGFLKDPDPKIASEAARAIYDDESIVAALPQLIVLLDKSSALPDAVARRALNACLRTGGKENAERLITYALRQDSPLPLRMEALELAMLWNDPPVLDRVDGRYRVIVGSADPKTLAMVALAKIDALMGLPEKELKAKVVQLLTIHRVPVESRVARAAVMEESASPEVRVEALRLLADQHPGSDDLVAALDASWGRKHRNFFGSRRWTMCSCVTGPRPRQKRRSYTKAGPHWRSRRLWPCWVVCRWRLGTRHSSSSGMPGSPANLARFPRQCCLS
ncbi:hypothetical protein [Verrucomicrobium spinosum]|uniref:hypothetical protein n=1 Tax=Verrucomicrobium spinosum TaxID=2736 RepID=UPI00210E80BA|nr:hypothetical protein [Verrucomicrobium spinosum]